MSFKAGLTAVTIDGGTHAVSGEAMWRVSGTARETLVDQTGISGFSVKPAQGIMEMTLRDFGSLTVAELFEKEDATVTFELANGKLVVGRNMWAVGEPPEVNTESGSFKIRFEGPDVQEV